MVTATGIILPSGGVIGESYKTRFGYVRLRPRDWEYVEGLLVKIPEDVAIARPGSGAEMWARPEFIEALKRWRYEAFEICAEKIGKKEAKVGLPQCSSVYRQLGTTAGSGKYKDPFGCIDSTDDYGHFSGYSGDVPTKYFRKACHPVLTVDEINLAAQRAGLTRPWLSGKMGGEWWHYRGL